MCIRDRIVNCSRVYKARPTACLTYFHLRRTSVVCVLEDMVTSVPYVSIVFVETLLFPDVYFIFLQLSTLVYDLCFWCFSFFRCFQHLRLSSVVFFTNREISSSRCGKPPLAIHGEGALRSQQLKKIKGPGCSPPCSDHPLGPAHHPPHPLPL